MVPVRNVINLLFFLVGLSLAFPILSYADFTSWKQFRRYPNASCFMTAGGSTYVTSYTIVAPSTHMAFYSYHGEEYDIEYSATAVEDAGTLVQVIEDSTRNNYCLVQVDRNPEPAEPAHCSNGQLDDGEAGIDCDGLCSAECQVGCPSGQEYFYSTVDNRTLCGHLTDYDAFGNCTGGAVKGSTKCVDPNTVAEPILFADSVDPPDAPPTTVVNTDGTFSVTSSQEVVVDNGDGTETATITQTMTSPDGNSLTGTTSVDRPSGSATGTGFSESGGVEAGYEGTVEEEEPEEAVVGSSEAPETLDFGDTVDEKLSQIDSKTKAFVADVQSSALIQKMHNVFSVPASGSSSFTALDFGDYGTHDIDSSLNQEALSGLAGVMRLCAMISGIYIIFRKA